MSESALIGAFIGYIDLTNEMTVHASDFIGSKVVRIDLGDILPQLCRAAVQKLHI